MSGLWQPVLPPGHVWFAAASAAPDMSGLQQPVLPMDMSGLQQPVLSHGQIWSTAASAAPWTDLVYSSQCCPRTGLVYSSQCLPWTYLLSTIFFHCMFFHILYERDADHELLLSFQMSFPKCVESSFESWIVILFCAVTSVQLLTSFIVSVQKQLKVLFCYSCCFVQYLRK
jgi:hypothetical protein